MRSGNRQLTLALLIANHLLGIHPVVDDGGGVVGGDVVEEEDGVDDGVEDGVVGNVEEVAKIFTKQPNLVIKM